MIRLAGIALLLAASSAGADPLADYLFARDAELRDRMQLPAIPRAPWFDDTELRFTPERDALDLSNETYSFRFRPTGIKERRAMRNLFSVENNLARIEWNEALGGALARRYFNVIDLAEQEVRTAVLRRQLALDQLQLTAQNSMSASSSYSNADLQEASLRVEQRKRDIDRSIQKTVQLRVATVSEWLVVEDVSRPAVSAKLLRPEQLAAGLEPLAREASAYISELARMDIRRAQHEVELERSRARFGIDLLELSYEDKLTDSYSVTLGFRIPLGRNKYGLEKRMRAANIARNHAYLNEQLLLDALYAAVRQIRWQIQDYQVDVATIAALEDRMESAASDVATLAALRQHELDLHESAAKTHLGILRDYIKLLNMAGVLQQPRNWLGSRII